MVTIRWTGAAGIEITEDATTLLIDPFHSRPGKLCLFFGRLEAEENVIDRYLDDLRDRTVEAIIASHTHYDHVLDIPLLSQRLECSIIGSRSLGTLLALNGRPGTVTVCAGGEQITLPGGATVTMIRSRHGLVFLGKIPYQGDINPACSLPMRGTDYRVGDAFISKVTIGGTTFMHIGSANFVEREIEGHRCDVLFMAVPGWKKSPGYCSRLLQIVQPKVIVPFHYDDFSSPLQKDRVIHSIPFQDMRGFLNSVSSHVPGCEIRMVRPFEKMTF